MCLQGKKKKIGRGTDFWTDEFAWNNKHVVQHFFKFWEMSLTQW